MPARPLVLYPDPRLKKTCAAVDGVDSSVRSLVRDLWDTMDAGPPRTVGIAAPQVGDGRRVAVVDVGRSPKHAGAGHGPLVLVNPTVVAHAGEQIGREGCLSLPDFTANVRRWLHVTVEAVDWDDAPCRIEATGFEAVVLQHEIDHLNGILFLDRVENIKTDLFRRTGNGPPAPNNGGANISHAPHYWGLGGLWKKL